MKKRILQMKWTKRIVLIALLLGVAGLGKMYAQNFTVDDLNYQVNNDGVSVTVTGHVDGQSATGSLVIPETVEYNGSTYSVTRIGYLAFHNCSGLTGSLTIPNSVTMIDGWAFSGCSGFTGILTIGNSVTTIGEHAFSSCSGFSGDLDIPNSVTSIGNSAFSGCSGFTGSLTIPNSVTSIGNYAFSGCSGFTGGLTIGNSVTTIGESAFYGCIGFTGSLTIGNSVTTINNYAFFGCSGFTGSLIIPSSVTTIGGYAFNGCSGFTGSLTIPNSVTMIGQNAFYNCSRFTGSLTIGNSVTTIGGYAFYGYFSSITVLAETPPSLSNNVFYLFNTDIPVYVPCGSVEEYASVSWGGFSDFIGFCEGMVVVMANPEEGGTVTGGGQFEANQLCAVTAIANEGYAFANWTFNGTVVSVEAEYTFYVAGDMTLVAHFVQDGNITFADDNVKSICVANWDTNGDGELSYAEAAAVTSIRGVFSGNTTIISFEELQYFSGLTTIADDAFYYCSNLSGALYIPNSVTSIGNYAFSGCSGLTGSLTIGNSVTTIGDGAFFLCSGLTGSLTIGNSVTTIGDYAFYICRGFTGSLTIPNSVTAIGNSAFYGCNFNGLDVDMTSIPDSFINNVKGSYSGFLTIGNSVIEIGECAFSGCSGFTGSLTIPNSVTTIGSSAFQSCSGLTGSQTIPNSVTTIGGSAFRYCSGLTGSLIIPNSVTTIGDYAFWGCSGFTGDLVIPNSVTTIDTRAFGGCSGFTGSLTIPNSVTTIGESAFYGCSGFTGSLTIPNSVTSIGNSAFHGCFFNGLDVDMSIPDSFINNVKGTYSGLLTIGNSVNEIGSSAFAHCSGFTGILIIPGSVTTIGEYAFLGCSGFTGDLVIPNSVTTIGSYAYQSCSGFTGSLTIPNSVTIISDGTFNGCSGFTGNLTIPNSVTTIGSYAFNGCSSFTGDLVIPNSVTTIDAMAFGDCSGFTGSLAIPNSITIISDGTFSGCSGFTGDLVIPNSVTTISTMAFGYCSGFTGSLAIPNSVSTIGSYAFSGCSNFMEAILSNVTPPSLEEGAFDMEEFAGKISIEETGYPIYVPYESLNTYKTATNWSYYEDRIFPMAYTAISGYGEGEGNYRFIASPLVENTAPTAVDNMITETAYDLYHFDQSENDEWQNYKYPENTPNFFLTNGQGYLYANAEDVNLIFKGVFNEDDTKEVGLAYDATATFAGWNLVGNPFPVNAYANKSYYTMNEEGTAIEPVAVSMETAIPACTGVMVMAEAEGETVVFSIEAPEAATNQGCLQITLAQTNERGTSTGSVTALDKAIVSFNAGDRLEKFVFNKENAVISIPQGGKELAIACSDKQGEMPLNFKASKNGEYTLTIHPEAVELDYLHLIDNLTGADVDLLALRQAQGPANYTFEAKTTDYASRFRLVFSGKEADGPSTGSETFAFINNGNIIITGVEADATLQIVDMTGRMVVSCGGHTRCVPTTGMAKGVYVLRLINAEDVRTQKIVVK